MSAFDAYLRLDGSLRGAISCDEIMARHTTYRIGGPAALFIECRTFSELAYVCDVLAEEGVGWVVLGKGSNVLVSDDGYDGAVLVLGGEFSDAKFGMLSDAMGGDPVARPGESHQVTIGAAVPLARVVQQALGHGLSGLEQFVGIPGTIGGAVRMNAGTRESWIGACVSSATTFRPGMGLRSLRGDELAWGYRTSGFAADEVIVEVTLNLIGACKDDIADAMQERLDARKAHQPLAERSCGSVFKNPPDLSAGKLISECGLAGARCGDAQISPLHANFIINTGSASANEVLALIRLARDNVKERHGIRLTPELRFLGFPL